MVEESRGGGIPNGRRIEGGRYPEWSWKTPLIHSDLWITPKTAPRSTLSRSAVAGKEKGAPGPRSSLLDALTGLLAELEAFLARRIGVVQLLARDEEPAQRPPEAPDGIFRVLVVLSDVGFRLCHGTSSRLHRKHPARVRSLLGDPWGYSTRRCGPVVGAIAGFEGDRIRTPGAVA